MGYSRAWVNRPYQQPGIVAARDPQHQAPSVHDVGRNWQTAPGTPAVMPLETVDDQAFTLDSAPGGLPWTPAGPDDGIGYGAGLSFAASAAQNDAAHARDDGSYLPRAWAPPVERDGTYSVDRVQWDVADSGIGSPGWVDQQRQLDRDYYPNRRVGHRIQRYRDRVYLRRNWNVEFRPITTPNAYSAPPLTELDSRSKYVSPYGDAVATNVRVVNTTAPQLRRSPAPWDESITQDGTAGQYHDPSFQSWGL